MNQPQTSSVSFYQKGWVVVLFAFLGFLFFPPLQYVVCLYALLMPLYTRKLRFSGAWSRVHKGIIMILVFLQMFVAYALFDARQRTEAVLQALETQSGVPHSGLRSDSKLVFARQMAEKHTGPREDLGSPVSLVVSPNHQHFFYDIYDYTTKTTYHYLDDAVMGTSPEAPVDGLPQAVFSPDSTHLLFLMWENDPTRQSQLRPFVVVDGVREHQVSLASGSLAYFSPNSLHYAYVGLEDRTAKPEVIVDGKFTTMLGSPLFFTPTSRLVNLYAHGNDDGMYGSGPFDMEILLDGVPAASRYYKIENVRMSADGKSVLYKAKESEKDAFVEKSLAL